MSFTPISQSFLNVLGRNGRNTHLHSRVKVASGNGRTHKLAGFGLACSDEVFHVRLPFVLYSISVNYRIMLRATRQINLSFWWILDELSPTQRDRPPIFYKR